MEKKINVNGTEINYRLRRSSRARRLSLSVTCDAGLVATLPMGANENALEAFIRAKADWILDKLSYFKEGHRPKTLLGSMSRKEYLDNKAGALSLIRERLEYFNATYKLKYRKISVRMQRTRWGSCSRKGNLNFNYKILSLPPELADYIIVHELCHLREFNHSRKFWDLVALAIPDYKIFSREIKKV